MLVNRGRFSSPLSHVLQDPGGRWLGSSSLTVISEHLESEVGGPRAQRRGVGAHPISLAPWEVRRQSMNRGGLLRRSGLPKMRDDSQFGWSERSERNRIPSVMRVEHSVSLYPVKTTDDNVGSAPVEWELLENGSYRVPIGQLESEVPALLDDGFQDIAQTRRRKSIIWFLIGCPEIRAQYRLYSCQNDADPCKARDVE